VRTPAGEVAYDPTQKAPGRGAYVCRTRSCLENAVRSGALARSLKVGVHREALQAVVNAINDG